MRPLLSLSVPSLLIVGMLSADLEAQLIEVRPGYVRTPFVRVQRRGLRGRIQTPFVDLGNQPTYQQPTVANPTSPGVAQPVPTGVPPHPTASLDSAPTVPVARQDLATMDWPTLRDTLVAAENNLDRQLNDLPDSQHLRQTLQIGALNELLDVSSREPTDESARTQLTQILDAYNQVLINPDLRYISQLSSFETVHSALHQILQSPRERLVSASRSLQLALARMQNGSTWSNYFQLPDAYARPQGLAATRDSDDVQLDKLMALQSRFESTESDPRYQPVANLSEFRAMYRQLNEYVDGLRVDRSQTVGTTIEPTPASNEPIVIRQRKDPASPEQP